MSDVEWMASGSCLSVGPDFFFPEIGSSYRNAKKVCRGCPVRVQCREFFLDEQDGIYGGTSPNERKRLRKQRAA